VDPRTCPDDLEKRKFLTLPGLELRPLSRPADSQSLYRLSFRGKDFKSNGNRLRRTAKEPEHWLYNNTQSNKDIFQEELPCKLKVENL
jgi:hypothetical protein